MAVTRKKAGKRRTMPGPDGLRARKSGASKAGKPGLRKPKPAKTDPRKQKPSLQSETARLKRQLKAARMQQEAGAEILRAVANASGDAAGPLQLIAETTARLFKASSVSIQIAEGSAFTQEYRVGAIAKRVGSAYPRSNIRVGGRNLPGTVVAESRQIHIPDLDRLDPSMSDFPGLPHARAGGARTVCGTPLRRDDMAIGALIVFRDRLLPFTGDELALLQSFADQAVIAIQNARLFNETQQALERQTATSEILRVISQSPTDVQPVFDAIVLTAVRLFKRNRCFILRCDSATYWPVALAGPDGLLPFPDLAPEPIHPDANFPSRAIVTGKNLHLPNWSAVELPEYERQIRDTFGFNSALYLPLLREGKCIGVLGIAGTHAGMFDDDEIALAESFRDQALIAIENARLFNETREALERQTATADILKIIGRSVAHAAPVFDAILASCQRLFNPYDAAVYLVEGDRVRGVARRGPGVGDWGTDSMPLAGSSTGVAIAQRRPLHFPDLADKADLPEDKRDAVRLAGGMSVLYAPIISESRGVGSLVVTRQPRKPFTETEVEFIQSFADQAAIAIENARLFDEVQAKTSDLEESLQQQTATADVLKVISRSAFDLQTVLETLARSAVELSSARRGTVFLRDGDVFRFRAASHPDLNEDWIRFMKDNPQQPGCHSTVGRAVASARSVCTPDTEADPEIRMPTYMAGIRAVLAVPLLRDGKVEGVMALSRQEPGEFTARQIELVETFADQAVIAIENTRLFNETRQALAYQTGSSNVLRVIASSPTDVDPVLKVIVESARELCEANDAVVLLKDAEHLRFSAHSGPIAVTLDKWPISRKWTAGRAFVDQKPVHVHDMLSGEGAEFPDARAMGQSTGATIHTVLSVPLLRVNESIGAILLRRTEVRPFNDKQINLLSTFADQAVIAIQNARLFNETREALERQTATADILKVIASSPDDVQPVFQAIAERSNHLVGGFATTVVSIVDEVVHLSAFTSTTPAADAALEDFYPRPLSGFTYSDAVRRGDVHRIVDAEVELAGQSDELAIVRRRGWRSALWVPLLLEGEAIGVIGVTRVEPGPFADHHVEMLKTFADQAVIAISNVNLFRQVQERTRELEESLQQQTATSEVLQVISRSVFDLKTVLQTLLESAAGLCDASICILFQSQGDVLHVGASYGGTPEFVEYLSNHPHRFDRTTVAGRAAVERRTIHIPDIAADTEYGLPQSIKLGGWQSIIGVPLLRDDEVLGVLDLARPVAGPFTPRQIKLIETFADQAVIAIENARLFDEVQQRTKELAASLDELRTAQDRLVQTEKLASLGQLTAGIAHEIKNPLNFVNNFAALSVELIDEMTEVFENPGLDEAGRRKELDEIRELLKSNLEKVVQHGKRADSIVKNMLLHSREGSGDQRAVDINALLDESLNLAYHGARAEKPDFNITLQRDLDPDAGVIELFPQEITRALLNLISNGFYAASKRRTDNGDANFEPVLSAVTKNLGNHIEIRIRDNGTGIPPEVKEKMFNPFFTTKPAGEGTGLGLSMSHDIIVKQHGGRIEVDTQPGQFTEFTIVLPRAANLASSRKS